MSTVLTESSTLTCTHSGTVKLIATQSKLTVNGSNVLVDGDLNGKSISGCKIPVDPNTGSKPCLSVTSTIGGIASKLKVEGKGVLLGNIQGTTDGNAPPAPPPQQWSVQDVGETKLKAV